MDLTKYKGIIFDFDGVILDSVNVKTEAFCQLYKHYGEEVVAKVKEYHLKHGGVSRFEKFRYFHNEILGIPINEEEVTNLSTSFNELVFEKVIASPYILGAKEYLASASKTHQLFICTGTPKTEIIQILKELRINHFFKGVYGSPTKKIDILFELMNEFHLTPDVSLYFGDAITDYEAARFYQLDFIGILNEGSSPFPANTLCFDNFSQL